MAAYLKTAIAKPKEEISDVQDTVSRIIEDVKTKGEDAVRFYSEKFDNWSPKSFRVSGEEIHAARRNLPTSMVEDIDFCQSQIPNFAQEQMNRLQDFEMETLPGVHLGQKIIPVGASGSYIPGGRYPLLASAHMTVITPKVAGVPRVVACSPPIQGKGLYPATLYSMVAAGADEIYCMGGVHALAAFSFGMAGLAAVDMSVGAGNKYVAEAKRQVFGTVGIDLLAAPTEILIVAAASTSTEYVGP